MQEAPLWDSRRRLLSVPEGCEAWDIQLAKRDAVALRVRPGVYECRFEAPRRARPAGTTQWRPVRERWRLFKRPTAVLEVPESPGETACVGLIYPDSQFMLGEELTLQFTMMGTNGGERAIAVISGVVVHPGSTVAGYEVVSVGERHVVLRNAAEEITLRMP